MSDKERTNPTAEEEKLNACKKELKELLDKYDCVLDVGVLILAGRMPQPIVKIVPKPSNLLIPNGPFPMGGAPVA